MNMISTGSFLTGTDATKEQDTLAGKFAAVWEKKNAKAARAGGVSLMALTLAACGSSSDDTAADAGAATDAATDEAATETTTSAITALQAEVGDIVLSNTTGTANVEAATLALASNANAATLTGTTTAPTTEAATQTMLGNAFALSIADTDGILTGTPVGDITTALNDAVAVTTFAHAVNALTANTAATSATLATQLAAISEQLTANANTNDAAVTTAQNAWGIGTAFTAAEAADLAAYSALATLTSNGLISANNTDAVTATASENAAGLAAAAAALVTAVATATGTTLTAAQSAAAQADLIAQTTTATSLNSVTQNTDNGNVTGMTFETELANAAAAIDVALGGGAVVATAEAAIVTAGGGAGAVNTYLSAVETQLYEASVTATFNDLLEAMQTVAAAQNAVDALDVTAQVIELQNDGSTVTIVTAAATAASANDDLIGYVTDNDVSTTIGTAAQAFGANGNDSLIIAGEYTFVTITKAQADLIATETLGDASALEIFVYQNATSGDAVLYVERTAGEGNVEGTTMSTITLTDVTFADLGQAVGDGLTVLSSAEAVVA